jgi:hypothetical protein
MRVRLKGINRANVKLAGGRVVTYWYAWRGGPRLPGKPGDPEFVAAYNAAIATKTAPTQGTLRAILVAYQESSELRIPPMATLVQARDDPSHSGMATRAGVRAPLGEFGHLSVERFGQAQRSPST